MRDKSNTVLVVDDVKQNVDSLISILSDQYNVMVALSGKMALASMQKKMPDIVLLDISMPGMSGFEVLKQMKEDIKLAEIPVIFVTGESDIESEENGLLLGAVDYIKKPYNAAIVKIKVRNYLELKMYKDGLESLVVKRTHEVNSSRDAIIVGMSMLAENRDHVTGDHIRRIKEYTKLLGDKYLWLNPDLTTKEYIEKTVSFSPMHDIGKVGIPDSVLQKNAKLTDEEYNLMKNHTLIGADLLKETDSILSQATNWLRISIEIAEAHHEKYDGTGYPLGLKGEEIPLSARIVALADVYDALTSERPYKKAFTHQEAMDIILVGDNRTKPEDFDPRVLEAFKQVEQDFRTVCEKQGQL